MAKFSWPVLGTALFLDILAFALACGALAKRSTATAVYSGPAYLTCGYTKDTSTGLAAAAFVFLLLGQVLITAVTKCFCCGSPNYKAGSTRICALLLLIFSWVTFLIAESLLLAGAIVNSFRTTAQVDYGVVSGPEDVFCVQVKKAVFATGVAFTFLTMLFSVVYYVLQASAAGKDQQWSSYRGEADPYGGHDGATIGMTAYH